MEFTKRIGHKRGVKVDGKSFLMPRNVDVMVTGVYRKLRMQAALRSCQVNGKKCSKPVVVVYHRAEINMETLLALRALRDALMPASGPAQLQVHAVIAALILRTYELEHGASGILDGDTISVQYKRHVYVMDATFVAGDLRSLDTNRELATMTDLFLLDVGVLSGTLESSPVITVSAVAGSPTGAAAFAGDKRSRVKPGGAGGRRVVTLDDGVTWVLPWGVYYLDYKVRSGAPYQMLRMQTVLGALSCQVDGKSISKPIQVTHLRPEITKGTVLALRALRDALLPMYGDERNQVHKVVAALILRSFDLEHPESDILDEAVVSIRIARHGYVKETAYVAGDLRTINRHTELTIMTERFLQDPTVMSGTLEATAPGFSEDPLRSGAKNLSPATPREGATKQKSKDGAPTTVAERDCVGEKGARCKGVTRGEKRDDDRGVVAAAPASSPVCTRVAATDTATPRSSNEAVVGGKRPRGKDEECRADSGDEGGPLSLPWGVYAQLGCDGKASSLLLKMKLVPVTVNGVECASHKKVRIVSGMPVNPRNIDALRSLRDDFGRGMNGSKAVRQIIAAKAFRLWLQGRKALETPSNEIVHITDAAVIPVGDVCQDMMITAGELRKADRERSRVLKERLCVASGDSKIQGADLPHHQAAGARLERGDTAQPLQEDAITSPAMPLDATVTDGATSASSKQKSKRKKKEKNTGKLETVAGVVDKKKKKREGKQGRRGSIAPLQDASCGSRTTVRAGVANAVVKSKAADGSPSSSASAHKQNKKASRKKRKVGANGADDAEIKRLDASTRPSTKANAARAARAASECSGSGNDSGSTPPEGRDESSRTANTAKNGAEKRPVLGREVKAASETSCGHATRQFESRITKLMSWIEHS